MKPDEVDFLDVQGLVCHGYAKLKEAHYFLARIKDVTAARAWLAKHEFTPAKTDGEPDEVLQVAFTFAGLQVLGISQAIQDGFPTDFRSGMTGDEARSRRLGDVGCNDPKKWVWGGPNNVPHLLVALIAKSPSELVALEAKIKGDLWDRAFLRPLCLSTRDMGGYEPFGFKDGISQPRPDWERELSRGAYKSAKPGRKSAAEKTLFGFLTEYTNKSALGEFLLGYPNEYGHYTDRPLVDPTDDPKNLLLRAEDEPSKKDFTRNGTYLVFRDLEQDVAAFWRYADSQATHHQDEKDRETERKQFAEAMVGRKMTGEPLVESQTKAIAGVKGKKAPKNQFTFLTDPAGIKCPFGAHIRRANPRTADVPDGTTALNFVLRLIGFGGTEARYDLLESVRFHRILRRGREYGPPPVPIDQVLAEQTPPAEGRGLRFICLNANILRQFEFLQNSWISNPRFNGLEEADPLLGNREKLCSGGETNTFTRPQPSGINCRHKGLPKFVTVRGGAYFFMPGLRALRYIYNKPADRSRE
jgi:deferrochelatase/peroxidase EfeB